MTVSRIRRVVPLACLLFAACGGAGDDGPTAPATVASVRVSPTAPSVQAGATVQLSATPLDANGVTLAARSVSWQSDAPAVAIVNAAGVVTGVAPGSAGIRAVIDGVTGTASVTVTPVPVATVAIAPSTPSLEAGDTLRLIAEARDDRGDALSGRIVEWSVADGAIATVSADGLLTAVAPGSTTVRATSELVTGEVPLVVLPAAVAAVTLSRDTATLVPNQPLSLTATVLDARQDTLTGRAVTWTSSAPAVATVAPDGVVTAVAVGSATITATSEAPSATAAVTVRSGGWVTPAGGTVSAGAVSLTFGAGAVAAPLAITVQPVTAPPADPRLIAGTAHEFGPAGTTFAQPVTIGIAYAPTSLNGANAADLRLHRLEAGAWVPLAGSTVDVGSTTVTGETSSFSTYAVLEVPPPVASITLTPTVAALAVDESVVLVPTLRDAAQNVLSNRDLSWTSSNGAVATVSATGTVTGVADGGPVTITATSEGQSATAQITVSSGFVLKDLTVGGDHSCGLTLTGAAYCWGRNNSGQLGIGTLVPEVAPRPRPVLGGHVFTSISAGETFTCALKASGAAYCWGENVDGQIGDGSTSNRATPTAVVGGHQFANLVAGEQHACGLSATGVARCWGDNSDGGIGDGTLVNRSVPTLVSGNHTFAEITGGEDFTCALTPEGVAWCWGDNNFGQLGDGTRGVDRHTPVQVTGDHVFAQISAGEDHSCAVKHNGEAWCWGNGEETQLGDGTDQGGVRTTPGRVAGSFQFTSVVSGDRHSCGLLTNGRAACWGDNLFGAVGDGTQVERLIPVLVSGDLSFVKLADGYVEDQSCALTAGGQAWCWGRNVYGAIGTGTIGGNVLVPSRVVEPEAAAVGGRVLRL